MKKNSRKRGSLLNPLCAGERSETNFQIRTTVDSKGRFPLGDYFFEIANKTII